MKKILVFNKDDESEYTLCVNGERYYLVLHDMLNFLRRKTLKQEHDFKTADEAIEATYDYLHEAMNNRGVSFDDVE